MQHGDQELFRARWTCPACGVVHDRDLNAAFNLKTMAVRPTVPACAEEGAGRRRRNRPRCSRKLCSCLGRNGQG
ncbi:MAG: zinc ribbon domain-containing protein [Betaproteobacteria bacterium]|nr:zinc ribbon domain-containing protein [Betaproteobacteria bacterium]